MQRLKPKHRLQIFRPRPPNRRHRPKPWQQTPRLKPPKRRLKWKPRPLASTRKPTTSRTRPPNRRLRQSKPFRLRLQRRLRLPKLSKLLLQSRQSRRHLSSPPLRLLNPLRQLKLRLLSLRQKKLPPLNRLLRLAARKRR